MTNYAKSIMKELESDRNNTGEYGREFHLLRSKALSLTDLSMKETGLMASRGGLQVVPGWQNADLRAGSISQQSSVAGRLSMADESAPASRERSVSPHAHRPVGDDFPVGFHQRPGFLPLLLPSAQDPDDLCISRPDTAFQIEIPAAIPANTTRDSGDGSAAGELKALIPYYITPRTLSRMQSSGRRLIPVFGFKDSGPGGAGLFLVEVRAHGRGAAARLAALQSAAPPILSSQPGFMSKGFAEERRERNRQIEHEWAVGAPPVECVSMRLCLCLLICAAVSRRLYGLCTLH
jgi:hypothetical protein